MHARAIRPSSSCLEPLESRLLLAGNVTASVAGGSLFLTGDNLLNDIVVKTPVAGQVRVESGASATTINGGAGPVTFNGFAGGIMACRTVDARKIKV